MSNSIPSGSRDPTRLVSENAQSFVESGAVNPEPIESDSDRFDELVSKTPEEDAEENDDASAVTIKTPQNKQKSDDDSDQESVTNKKKQHQGKHEKDDSSGDTHKKQPIVSGDVILSHFGLLTESPQVTGDAPIPSQVDEQLNDVCNAVAEKMLVSDGSNGPKEVRIFLKNSLLPDTQFRIFEAGGKTQVEFLTKSGAALSTLQTHVQNLEAKLQQKMPDQRFLVRVEMDSHSQEDRQDGRSNNQRSVEEEWNPDDA